MGFGMETTIVAWAGHDELGLDSRRRLDELRTKVAAGLAEADRGECEPLDLWEILAEVEQEVAEDRASTRHEPIELAGS